MIWLLQPAGEITENTGLSAADSPFYYGGRKNIYGGYMKELFSVINEAEAMKELLPAVGKTKNIFAYGLSGTQRRIAVASTCFSTGRPMVVIVSGQEQLAEWKDDFAQLLPEIPLLELPEVMTAAFSTVAQSAGLLAQRRDVLGRLMRGEKMIVLVRAAAAIQKELACEKFTGLSLQLKVGCQLERDELIERLAGIGYERSFEVECMGQFSVRGGIVDVFPINAAAPLRVEFFDNEIDSLRLFETDTKRSRENINEFVVLPLATKDNRESTDSFLSYMKDGIVVFDDPMKIRDQLLKTMKENPEFAGKNLEWEELVGSTAGNTALFLSLMLQKVPGADADLILRFVAKETVSYHRQFELFADDVREYLQAGSRVVIFAGTEERADEIQAFLLQKKLKVLRGGKGIELPCGVATIMTGRLLNGFELPSVRLAVFAEKDIWGRQKKRGLRRTSEGRHINHFAEISIGDYVVHINHGIGKYIGVETIEINGIHRDYLHIKYAGNDKLYVPVDQVQLLQKYIGTEGDIPRLHRLNGNAWERAKAKVKSNVENIARELLSLYAKRQVSAGYACQPDTVWQKEFEDSFPFEETPDQLVAIEEIKRDMEKPGPMERLLCGDVGFGKTEVAMRAAFKAVMSGKQVAVLVPTTVLAQQHFQTFSMRFADFGPEVDVLCRFRTAQEQKATIEKTKAGKVDILIGTHALLNQKKVQFKDLGLLIVDEEQRFGVKQKEKIKNLSAGIDVLTLSATPIPRTLHMSLAGARDMSIIETPPEERLPIQTYVIEADDEILAGAIRRELRRGGQIYFVYNRVETIYRMYLHLSELVPEARTGVAHGQMAEKELEQVMVDFFEKKYDILLATSIVENGLDVANANTIIVYDADRFGLAQLYQMRGRVGRSKNVAFAYLVYRRDKVLTETAEKRLQTMKDFAELGAGFKIAMRDLEIRGAGDILGAKQHGHIASVGFGMYCQMLEEAVQRLNTGKTVEIVPEPVIILPVEAYIDNNYIEDAVHKIEIYQRLASIRNEEQLANLLDEMIDRFGEPTAEVMRLLEIVRIKNYARDIGIKQLEKVQNGLTISFLPEADFELGKLVAMKEKYGRAMQLFPQQFMVRIKISPAGDKNLLGFVLAKLKELKGE